MRRGLFRGVVGSIAVGIACVPMAASAAEPQPSLVSVTATDVTPQVVATSAVPQPHVDAVGVVGGTTVVGGLFDTVTQGGKSYSRGNVAAFDSTTGAVSTAFDPVLSGGQVWAIATDPATNSVYVGGKFTTVDGVARAALVKLNATTGERDPNFKPAFTGGQINDLEILTLGGVKRLVVAGGLSRRLMSVNPATGVDDKYFKTVVADAIPEAWGGLSVYQFAVDPSRTHLVATGNFRTVDGQARSKLFMLDIGSNGPSLSSWYYPGFAKACSSTAPRRIANLQGVDWSPDRSGEFTVTATGQIPLTKADIWYERLGAANAPNTTVCDGVGRFALNDPTKPLWINYTGGDSVWQVADTGAGVYVSGHFKWLDDPDGYASLGIGDKTSGAPAAPRAGIGSIDPRTGLANAWNPGLTATKIGGKALLATSAGLWVGNDATHFRGKPHYGLAFAPLP